MTPGTMCKIDPKPCTYTRADSYTAVWLRVTAYSTNMTMPSPINLQATLSTLAGDMPLHLVHSVRRPMYLGSGPCMPLYAALARRIQYDGVALDRLFALPHCNALSLRRSFVSTELEPLSRTKNQHEHRVGVCLMSTGRENGLM